MKQNNVFLDSFVDFDTMSDGKSSVELFDQLASPPSESSNKSETEPLTAYEEPSSFVGARKAEPALAVFERLGLVDTIEEHSAVGVVSVDRIQQFVDRFDNPQEVKSYAATSASSEIDDPALGVGGFASYIYSKLFLSRFQVENDQLLSGVNRIAFGINGGDCAKVTGKIRDYLFIADPDNKFRGSGHLSIDMLFEVDRDITTQESLFFHWDISVHNFTVHVRDDSQFPDLPFPELQREPEPKVIFPESLTDPRNPLSVWARGLNHKLFAEGKDCDGKDNFSIANIYESRNGNDLVRLESEGPNRHPWYVVTEDSCIDLMFKGYPPAAGLPPQANYCLGRCKHPLIVNTCGGG